MVSDSVKKYVEEKDLDATRIALTTIGYIADHDSFEDFRTSTEYAKDRIDDLFQDDDNQLYDESMDAESYKNIIKMMMSNFSEKKYKSAIKIGASVFANESEKYDEAGNGEPESGDFFTKITKHPMQLIVGVIIFLAIIAFIISLLK